MVVTYRTEAEFQNAALSLFQHHGASAETSSTLARGIASAQRTLRDEEADEASQGYHLKVGSWVIRDDDVPIFQTLNATAAAVTLTLTTGGLAWPAIAAALTAIAEMVWRMWRKGGRLSPRQVSVYGFLQALGPIAAEELLAQLCKQDKDLRPDALGSILQSLTEIELNDGRILALAAQDSGHFWKALRV